MPPAARASYARLARARWGIDDDGLLLRTDERSTQRFDVSDPGLSGHEVATPPEGALHWVVASRPWA